MANRPLKGAGRGLVFVHVPKCGGSAVERALRRALPLGKRLIHPEASFEAARSLLREDVTQHEVLARASELRRDVLHQELALGAQLVTGHAPLGPRTIEAFGETHDFVTVLRSPAERLRSHLLFNRTPAAGHGRTDETVVRFLEGDRARVMGALYVKYLSGLPMTADLTAQGAIDAARRTVDRLALCGFTSEMDGFAADLSALTGRKVRIGRENQGGGGELPSGLTDRIEALCAPDRAVYAHARARFSDRRLTPRGGPA
jgi:hypothetical protein